MHMTHTVIARNPNVAADDKNVDKSIYHLIVTFNERHVAIAARELKAQFPDCVIEVRSTIDDREEEKSGR